MSIKKDKDKKRMTESDFAAKIEWEGGIVDALEYGLKYSDCEPGELRNAWEKLEVKWATIQDEINAVEDILNQIEEEEDEE